MDHAMSAHAPEAIERLARKRAAAKMGWFIHASVYLAVNTLLLLAAQASFGHRTWSLFPALGWGIGLAIHGAVVFLVTGGGGLHERLVERERRQLQATKEPW
jgi:hypothetical protein